MNGLNNNSAQSQPPVQGQQIPAGAQQMANQPVAGPVNPTNIQSQPSYGTDTKSKMDPTLAAFFAWIFPPITSLYFLVSEKKDYHVRFYAMQSLMLSVFLVVLVIGLAFLSSFLVVLFGAFVGTVFSLTFLLLIFVSIGIWAYGLLKAYQGDTWELPIIGPIANDWASR